MRIAALALIVVLAGCAGPPPPPPEPPATAQQVAASDFCGAVTIWLQHPALLSFEGQRRTDARLRRAATAWLPPTREVLAALPTDAPNRVHRTMTNLTRVLHAAKHGAIAEAGSVVPLAAADLKNLLRYVEGECLSG